MSVAQKILNRMYIKLKNERKMPMNKERRKQLLKANDLLQEAKSIISSVRSDEEMALDNIPENLQDSERYNTMSDNVDDLSDIFDDIEDIIDNISEVVDRG